MGLRVPAVPSALVGQALVLGCPLFAHIYLGLIDNWTKPECGDGAETEYQEVQ